ncbi:hypothetical protein [Streptomyces tubercidicus]|uniref:hypothetical protein n=1 Tax=Streptomyces tubercidicus TaxID=47759 RepID=UPI002E1341B2|nr:hypothetical protein OG761_08840 [Streptomyces tubercidicus]
MIAHQNVSGSRAAGAVTFNVITAIFTRGGGDRCVGSADVTRLPRRGEARGKSAGRRP